MPRTRFAGLSDVGRIRALNEDSILVEPPFRAAAVADGMGGHRSGDVASQLAVSTLRDFLTVTLVKDGTWPFPIDPRLSEEENYLITGLRLANRRIFDRSLREMSDFGMGTTMVAAMVSPAADRVAVANVGDSRCYRLRGDTITQLTRDHSLASDASTVAPWLSQDEIRQIPSNVITRALGIREDVVVDLFVEAAEPGDVFLLCSDGLTGMLEDDEMVALVVGAPTLEDACRTLVDRANQRGGVDNISVVLISIDADPTA